MKEVFIMTGFFFSFALCMGVSAWIASKDFVGTAALIAICSLFFFGSVHIKIDDHVTPEAQQCLK